MSTWKNPIPINLILARQFSIIPLIKFNYPKGVKLFMKKEQTVWPWEQGTREAPTNRGVGEQAQTSEHGPVVSAVEVVRPNGKVVSRIETHRDGFQWEIVVDKDWYAPGVDKMPPSIRGANYPGAPWSVEVPVVGHTRETIIDHMVTEAMLSHDNHVGTKRIYFDASGNPVEVTRRGNGIAEARWNGRIVRYDVHGEITPKKKSWWPF